MSPFASSFSAPVSPSDPTQSLQVSLGEGALAPLWVDPDIPHAARRPGPNTLGMETWRHTPAATTSVCVEPGRRGPFIIQTLEQSG